MYTYPNQHYSVPYYPAGGSQYATFEPPPSSPLSTMALQDIVEGQQRAMNGLGSLLSQERTCNERSTRDNKQQLTNLVALSQNLLGFIPDVEQKFLALETFIRGYCDEPGLQDRVNDMVQVITNLRRIAESFACSTGLRLVPVRHIFSPLLGNSLLLRAQRLINGLGSLHPLPRPLVHLLCNRITHRSARPSRRHRISSLLSFQTQRDQAPLLKVTPHALFIGPVTLTRPLHLIRHHGRTHTHLDLMVVVMLPPHSLVSR